MTFPGSVLAILIVATTTVGDGADPSSRPFDPAPGYSQLGSATSEPSYAPVQISDRAPDFTWVGIDNRAHRLRDVLAQAHALLVFAPSDEVLQSLERERDALAMIGVVPVAVIDARGRTAYKRAKAAGVHMLIVPDPTHVIGAQFNLLEPGTLRLQPGWFAVDRRGVVRGYGGEPRDLSSWTRLAASALAIPAPDVPLPARTR